MELQYRRTFHKLLTVRFLDVGEGHVLVAETRLGVPLAAGEGQSLLRARVDAGETVMRQLREDRRLRQTRRRRKRPSSSALCGG